MELLDVGDIYLLSVFSFGFSQDAEGNKITFNATAVPQATTVLSEPKQGLKS